MPLLRKLAALLVAATVCSMTPPAFAGTGVFGGSTSAREAIVLTTDGKVKKLRSAVIAWDAACRDGMSFSLATDLTAVVAEPGFSPGPDDLVVSRNGKGRFAGTQVAAWDLGPQTAVTVVELSGTTRAKRASGKLAARVSIVDNASGDETTSCSTGTVSWSATRSPGRVYGGKTAQDEPVVARLDRKRKTVADLLVGWASQTCEPPDNYFRFGEHFGRFPVRSGRFGGTFDESFPMDDGGTRTYAYELAGSVARRSMRGSLRVTITGTDAAGATTLTCDSGKVSWKATTG